MALMAIRAPLQPSLLALFDRYRDSKGKQAKLKTAPQLQEVRLAWPALTIESMAVT